MELHEYGTKILAGKLRNDTSTQAHALKIVNRLLVWQKLNVLLIALTLVK